VHFIQHVQFLIVMYTIYHWVVLCLISNMYIYLLFITFLIKAISRLSVMTATIATVVAAAALLLFNWPVFPLFHVKLAPCQNNFLDLL